jgi:hypothetical protein
MPTFHAFFIVPEQVITACPWMVSGGNNVRRKPNLIRNLVKVDLR